MCEVKQRSKTIFKETIFLEMTETVYESHGVCDKLIKQTLFNSFFVYVPQSLPPEVFRCAVYRQYSNVLYTHYTANIKARISAVYFFFISIVETRKMCTEQRASKSVPGPHKQISHSVSIYDHIKLTE